MIEPRQLAPQTTLQNQDRQHPALRSACPIDLPCIGLGHMASWWPGQGYFVLPAAHLPASTGPLNHHLQKQSYPGPQHKCSQLDSIDTSTDELHGNIAQEATFWSKTDWRPQGRVTKHWETSQDTHTEKLTTEHPPATYVPQSLLRVTKTPL